MVSHTPGTWSFSVGNLVRVSAPGADGWQSPVVVCGVHRIGRLTGKERDAEVLANARLIAAAPDLLEALKACEAWIVDLAESGDAGFWDASKAPQVIQARAAIAKATGGTP